MKKMSFLASLLLMATLPMCVLADQQLYIYYKLNPAEEVGQDADRACFLLAPGQKSVHPVSSYAAGTDMTCQAVPPDGMRVKDWLTATGAILPPTAAAKSTGESDESFVWTCTEDAYATILVAFDYIQYKIRYASDKGTTPAEKTLNYAESYNLASVANIPAGYAFKRWDATSDQVTLPKSSFAAKDEVSGVDFGLKSYRQDNAVVNLTARFEPKTYEATAVGENCTVSWSQTTGTYDEELNLTWNYGSEYKFTSMTVYAGSDATGTKLRQYTSEPVAFKMSDLNAYYGRVYIKVVCEKKTYSLTVDPNGGSYNDSTHPQNVGKLVAGETNLNQLAVPVHTNYFDGYWDSKNGGNKVYDANGRFNPGTYWNSDGRFVGASDLTVYALWGDPLPTYQVHFAVSPTEAGIIRVNYGGVQTTSNDFALTVVENFRFEMTASPTNSGYSFSRWTNNLGFATNDNPWTSVATSDVANVAVFTGNVYKVTYHGGEGSVPREQVKFVSFGGTYGEPETPVTAEGRAFEGWYKDQSYAEESRVEATDKVGLGNIDLYAKWRELGTYTICFDKNDEKAVGTMDDQKPYCETETALNTNCYTKTGYTFSHWTDEGGTNYLDGAIVKDLVARDDTKTLYAVWSNNVYWVDYNPNGGTVSMASQQFTYDEPQELKCNPTHPDNRLEFAGWSTNGVDVAFTNHESVVELCTGAAGDERIMLLALWKPREEDVGDYSRAMHCDNLYWDGSNTLQTTGSFWETNVFDEAGCIPPISSEENPPPSGSQVKGTIVPSHTETPPLVTTGVLTSGTLSVCYKLDKGYSETYPTLELSYYVISDGWHSLTNWTQGKSSKSSWRQAECRLPAEVAGCQIGFILKGDANQAVCLDQVKWEPDGLLPSPVLTLTNAVPEVVTDRFVYDGEAKTMEITGTNCVIVGNVATNAGTYVATATVTNGVWEGGSFAPMHFEWTIEKAAAPDVSDVTFEDATFEYDGESHSIAVSGTVPDGVEVVYSGDPTNRTEVGTNTVTASFKVLDEVNYEAITTTLTAKLTIVAPPPPPPPPPPVVTNEVPVAVLGLVYDGTAKVGVLEGPNYVLTGNVATNVGTYVATATLTNGVWVGGSSEPTNIVWTIAEPPPPPPVVTNEVPVAVQGLFYDGTAKVGVLEGPNYVLTGNVATNAGTYVATATLTNGVWTGGSSEPTNIVWTIASGPAETGRLYYPQQLGAFEADAAVTYSGWLRDPKTGAIVALLQVKTTKAKVGKPSKSTISITPVGGKKKTYKSEVMPGGNPFDVFGIVYGEQGLSGSVYGFAGIPDGATVEAAKDFAKAKDIRAGEIPQGCRTLSLRVADGGRDSFSVTVDKKGKAKVSGQLAEGVSMSQSVLGSLGQDAFAVPVSYSKKITSKATGEKLQLTFAFVLWISSEKTWISDVQGVRWTDGEVIGQRLVERPADALYEIGFVLPEGYLATTSDGNRLSPTGEVVQVLGKKWITEKTVGSVKYDAATDTVYVKPSASGAPANLSKLKLTYTEKKGTVKGSFKLYYLLSGKLKSDSATVTGVAVDGAFVGNVVIRKKGPPLLIDWK